MVTTGTAPARADVVSRTRLFAFYMTCALLGLVTAYDFVMHAFTFAAPHEIHVVVHEIVSAFVITIVVSQLVAPRSASAAAQALLVLFAGAWGLDALTLRFSGLGVVMALGLLAALLHPARAQVVSFRGQLSPALAVLTVLGAIPLVPYILAQATYQRQDFEPLHALLGHWEWAATWAALTLLFGALAALKTPGFRLVAWLTGLGALVFGAASLAYPGEASAAPGVWAGAAVIGGVAFIIATEWESRRKLA
ncbi:MAG TPA: hypothetical protein VF808_07920 [Ktedonobacterales bacterium]